MHTGADRNQLKKGVGPEEHWGMVGIVANRDCGFDTTSPVWTMQARVCGWNLEEVPSSVRPPLSGAGRLSSLAILLVSLDYMA